MDALDMILKYIVLPVGGFVWMMFARQHSHHTDIEVLKAQASANKEAHDRELKAMNKNFERVFEKLDAIEEGLRK